MIFCSNLNITIKEPKDVAKLLMNELRYEKREITKVLILNTKNVLQKIVEIGIGNISSTTIDIKQIFEENLKLGMNRFILVHNHPSGDPTPSAKDIELTKKLHDASNLMDMQFLDHVVIGDGKFQSIFAKLQQKTKN